MNDTKKTSHLKFVRVSKRDLRRRLAHRVCAPVVVVGGAVTVHTPALPETQELANIKNKLEK